MNRSEVAMRTVALRFSENFAPAEGTIAAHEEIIKQNGFVWYGKLGAAVSAKVVDALLKNEEPRILLIHSGKANRYWAYIDKIQRETPAKADIPRYYRDMADDFSCWIRVKRFEKAESDVMAKCTVASSGESLSYVSKSSMSPYFIIEYSNNS